LWRKIFLPLWIARRERSCARDNACETQRSAHARNVDARRATSRKPAIHRHFCMTWKFLRAPASTKKFFAACLVGDRGTETADKSGAALTHKIKQSHCYFFPAVVIGMQCWSIRDRTAPNDAIHSR
jgi:hypothetical protein